MTIEDLCKDAAQEIGVIEPGEDLDANNLVAVRNILRRLLNAWNADRRAVYATLFESFTLIANPPLNYITIGPGGDFDTTQRPVSIDGANLVLTPSTPPVYTSIKIRDFQWWLKQTTPTLTSTYPTDLYYQPDWPLGKLYFWPVPTFAYDVQLMSRVVLDDTVDSSDDFSLPPGYQNAITLTLAEMSMRTFGKPTDPMLTRDASMARAAVFNNNDQIPKLLTKDYGMTPSKGGNRADFLWTNGQVVSR